MSFWICETCAVEHSEQVDVCAICADERQWVPADGQHWTTLEQLSAARFIEISGDRRIALTGKGRAFGRFVTAGRKLFGIASAN